MAADDYSKYERQDRRPMPGMDSAKEEWHEFYAVWRALVGDDLLGGYAVLDYPGRYGP